MLSLTLISDFNIKKTLIIQANGCPPFSFSRWAMAVVSNISIFIISHFPQTFIVYILPHWSQTAVQIKNSNKILNLYIVAE